MKDGRAVGPIFLSTWDLICFSRFDGCLLCLRIRNATGTSPFSLSGIGTTAHSFTNLCWLIASSSSAVDNRWPATFITSSVLPVIRIKLSLVIKAPSLLS